MRDALRSDAAGFRRLDAAQLVKHAFGLRSAAHRDAHEGKIPVLVYLYAEPVSWPDGAAVPREAIVAHRAEIARFAEDPLYRLMGRIASERGERIMTPSMTAWPPTSGEGAFTVCCTGEI